MFPDKVQQSRNLQLMRNQLGYCLRGTHKLISISSRNTGTHHVSVKIHNMSVSVHNADIQKYDEICDWRSSRENGKEADEEGDRTYETNKSSVSGLKSTKSTVVQRRFQSSGRRSGICVDSESQDGCNTTQPTLLRHVGLYVLNGENFKSIKRKDVHNIIRLQKQNSKETLADYTNDYSTNATGQATLTDDKVSRVCEKLFHGFVMEEPSELYTN